MNRTEYKLLPAGSLNIHAETSSPTNADLGRDAAAALIERLNRPEYLRGNFLRGPSVAYRRAVAENGVVQVNIPSSPYGYGGLMVLAADNKLFDPINDPETAPNGQVPAKTIFDYDLSVQKEYFRQTLAAMKAMESVSLPRENEWQDTPRVLAVENNTCTVSNEDHRMSRSIALPHLQVFRAGSWIDTDFVPKFPAHIKKEQLILRQFDHVEEFVSRLSSTMRTELGDLMDTIDLSVRTVPPYGHTLSTSIFRNQPLGDQAELLQRIMQAHQTAYTSEAAEQMLIADKRRLARIKTREEELGRLLKKPRSVAEKILPQPSMRTYLHYDERGFLICTISPEIVSPAGVLEAAEVFLHRHSTNPNPYSRDALDRFRTDVVDRMRNYLVDNGEKTTISTP